MRQLPLALFLLPITLLAGEVPGFTPVPPSLLDGSRLTVSSTYTLSAPSADWQWFSFPAQLDQTKYVCFKNPKGPTFFATLTSHLKDVNADTVKLHIERDKKQGESIGIPMSNVELKESPLPVPGKSFRCTYAQKNFDGSVSRHVQYLIMEKNALLSLETQLEGDKESAEFTEFLKSLKPRE